MEGTAPFDTPALQGGPPRPRVDGSRITIVTADGYRLAGHRYAPSTSVATRAMVVLPAAMGVRQSFYAPFAQYLVERGFAVTTFDYRGMGASAPKRLRDFPATLDDWAHRDYDAVLRDARGWLDADPKAAPGRKLFVVGHSLGGQLAGIVPSRHLIDGLVTVGSGSGYWRENAPRLKRSVWFLWYFAVPVYTALAGYFPGARVRKVADLPKGVILQWARWCRDPDYLVGIEPGARASFATVTCPLLSLSFADDEMMSARNIDAMNAFYANAPTTVRRIAPRDVGVARIGHFGFFRPSFEATLWKDTTDWLQKALLESKTPETRWTS